MKGNEMSEVYSMNLIELRGTNFHVGSFIIPLQGRKRMHALIKFLLEHPEGAKRDCIRGAIYPHSAKELSFRLRDSQDCSLSKLISRSRGYLKQALSDSELGQSIRWLVYCEDKKFWRLSNISHHPEACVQTLPSSPKRIQSFIQDADHSSSSLSTSRISLG
jgi:hypothetical protein